MARNSYKLSFQNSPLCLYVDRIFVSAHFPSFFSLPLFRYYWQSFLIQIYFMGTHPRLDCLNKWTLSFIHITHIHTIKVGQVVEGKCESLGTLQHLG